MMNRLKEWLGGAGGAPDEADQRYRPLAASGLELREGLPAYMAELEARLDEAMPEEWLRQVRERILSSDPELSEIKHTWMERELKRHFFLLALLRKPPLYNADLERMWREMEAFSRDYEQFCERYAGYYIQPQQAAPPSPPGAAARQARGAYELLYGCLFQVQPESQLLIGPFHRLKLDAESLEELQASASPCAALGLLETSQDEKKAAIEALRQRLRERCALARRYHEAESAEDRDRCRDESDPSWVLLAYSLETEQSPYDPLSRAVRPEPAAEFEPGRTGSSVRSAIQPG
ncbi:hypothetical protein NYE40_02815 [Paenibacillus sp. FSL W8-1187]|uniref:hypothetical protein n=1 Tax=Paenibacillus sp. FSL W8-1187 TaxID=2975339 RepID=UPI0030D9BC32